MASGLIKLEEQKLNQINSLPTVGHLKNVAFF